MKQDDTVIEYLSRYPVWHIDMLEALRRGNGAVAAFRPDGVLIALIHDPGCYLLSAESYEAAKELLKSAQNVDTVVARGEGADRAVLEKAPLSKGRPCAQAAYLGKEPLSWESPGLTIVPYRKEDIDQILAHYDVISCPGYFLDRIEKGELFAARYKGELAGFAGLHNDGAMGMLEVFPGFRKLGIGRALEKFMINFCLSRSYVPYGQIIMGNEASFSLQSHLYMTVERQRTLCWYTVK